MLKYQSSEPQTYVHIPMNLMIKMINLIDVIPYMTVMTDISELDTRHATGIPLAIE